MNLSFNKNSLIITRTERLECIYVIETPINMLNLLMVRQKEVIVGKEKHLFKSKIHHL